VVALNRFGTDSPEEIDVVRRTCEALGVPFALADHFERGGEGAEELARTVLEHAEKSSDPFRPLYDWSEPVERKIEKIARYMYGAREVAYTKEAERDLGVIRRLGFEGLPICVAKTPTSLTDDPKLAGRPEDFEVTVRNFVVSAGAGFVVALLGDILRMPGLPREPTAHVVDLVGGEVRGLR
jgi:formate--tetrahydrofolate ligase